MQRPLRARSFEEYLASAPPEEDWLIEELLPGGGLHVLLAKPKTGKSILAAQVSEALKRGTAVLNRRVVRPMRVLYVQLDATPKDWRKQARQLGLAVSDTLDVEDVPRFFLDSLGERQRLAAFIKAEGYEYVIWDALEKLTQADLNPVVGMQVALTRLQSVWGGPRLVIHHPRKPSGDAADSVVDAASGSHYLTGEASAIWLLNRTGKFTGNLQLRGRYLDDKLELGRDEKTYAWKIASSRPAPAATLIKGW